MKSVVALALATISTAFLLACGSSPAQQSQMPDRPDADKAGLKEKKIKPYDKVITKEAVSDSGLFIVHRLDGKFFQARSPCHPRPSLSRCHGDKQAGHAMV